MTILEAMITIVVLALLISVVYGVLTRTTMMSTNLSSIWDRQDKGRRALDRIVTELRFADMSTVTIGTANGSQNVTFQYWEDNGGTPGLSTAVTFQVDDDEGTLARIQGTDTLVLCHGLNTTQGFGVTTDGSTITLTVRLPNPSNPDEPTEVAEVETSVSPRN